MTKSIIMLLLVGTMVGLATSAQRTGDPEAYAHVYQTRIEGFSTQLQQLLEAVNRTQSITPADREQILQQLDLARDQMKAIDIWLRYLDPVAYKKINGPLPVEWETEVFEKFEKPYKRVGGGLTLAAQYLNEANPEKDSLSELIRMSVEGCNSFTADSTWRIMRDFSHFFLCNRLYLLNLATIYTTGFECPDTNRIIPELKQMLKEVGNIYAAYNESFPKTPLTGSYLELYARAQQFVGQQPATYSRFDHFVFIRDYIHPLFVMNQAFIRDYGVVSESYVDYSLNPEAKSMFGKDLYFGQNTKGIFRRVKDPLALAEIERLGKLLFYDPLLSGNNNRSCASCHKSEQYFTDTSVVTAMHFNHQDFLSRNTPSLVNVEFNHLLMLDGKHITFIGQAKDVMHNPQELAAKEAEILEKLMSCSEYKNSLKALMVYTPQEKAVTMDHVISAITMYFTKFSYATAPFDEAMLGQKPLEPAAVRGFNLFMSKAQCGTCHFLPQFNGVKPPYVGSEFEVLGVPADKNYTALDPDAGRFLVHPAKEMRNAFRTGTLRNSSYTSPYMHNGVFRTLEEVIDFYDGGGGAGRGLSVPNQTLSADSLHLSAMEKEELLAFLRALNEQVRIEKPPVALPASSNKTLNQRKVGGDY